MGQDMSSRRIMQTVMHSQPTVVPKMPFFNVASDIEKNVGFRTGVQAQIERTGHAQNTALPLNLNTS